MSGPRSNGKRRGKPNRQICRFLRDLEPQEAPDFRGYARILRKRFPTVLIVFSYFVQHSPHRHAQTETCVRAQVLLEIQKENPDIPTIQELYELDSVSTLICDPSTPSWPAKAWRAV